MRLTSRWTMPTTVPTAIVTMAMVHRTGARSQLSRPPTVKKKRRSARKAVALTPAAMKPVTGVGAPW